jgi:hypothetical protein
MISKLCRFHYIESRVIILGQTIVNRRKIDTFYDLLEEVHLEYFRKLPPYYNNAWEVLSQKRRK